MKSFLVALMPALIPIPFDTPLSKEIITDKYGIMPAYQQHYKTENS